MVNLDFLFCDLSGEAVALFFLNVYSNSKNICLIKVIPKASLPRNLDSNKLDIFTRKLLSTIPCLLLSVSLCYQVSV